MVPYPPQEKNIIYINLHKARTRRVGHVTFLVVLGYAEVLILLIPNCVLKERQLLVHVVRQLVDVKDVHGDGGVQRCRVGDAEGALFMSVANYDSLMRVLARAGYGATTSTSCIPRFTTQVFI